MRSEDDVGGRAKVTRDEERVLRGGWTDIMQMWRLDGCEEFVIKWDEFVFDAFRYFEPVKTAGVIWQDEGALTVVNVTETFPMKANLLHAHKFSIRNRPTLELR